ncbi:sensor histidine kinase [Methylocystis bryophila]|nr:HAMP domain-containing sensor histidine kinase [Methylocystis bryophila]
MLLLVLLLGSVPTWGYFIWSGFYRVTSGGEFRFSELSYPHLLSMVQKSILLGQDGAWRFEPIPELKQRLARDRDLNISVWDADKCEELPGFLPDFTGFSILKILPPPICGRPIEVRAANLQIRNDSGALFSAMAMRRKTDMGPVIILVWGGEYRSDDLVYLFLDWFSSMPGGWPSLPIFALAATTSWFLLHRGLSPLRELVARLDGIDLDSSNALLPEENVPVEVVPLVSALNGALARLDAGIAQQKRFVANAAHELRTPIAALRARLDNPRDEDLRKDMRRGLRQLQAISEQLLASARIAARGAATEEGGEKVDLTEVVRDKAADYAPLAVENGRQIEFEGSFAPVRIRGTRQAVGSVVTNLIDNALRAEPLGGAVVLRLSADATLEVVDHGEGVAPEDRALVFEPFWRKRDAYDGAGLGLSITKELVEKHDGRIWIEETPGGGATFKVSFPLEGEEEADKSAARHAARGSSGEQRQNFKLQEKSGEASRRGDRQ